MGQFPIDIQETFLIEDLLFSMTSIEGVYIKRKSLQSQQHVQSSSSAPAYGAAGSANQPGQQPLQQYEYQIEP